MVTEIGGKRVFISVPLEVGKTSGVTSFSGLGNEVTIYGPNDTSLGTLAVTKSGTTINAQLTQATGHKSAIQYTGTKGSDGNVSISGTYNNLPFSTVFSSSGQIISHKAPTSIDETDGKVFAALLHIELPPKPSPTIPVSKGPENPIRHEKAVAGGRPTGPVAGAMNIHCTLALVALAAAGWELGPLSLSVGIHIAAFECLL
jgi:hypothetical protein